MMLEGRKEAILTMLRAAGQVEVEALARQFGVSTQTIRADLRGLCDLGLAARTHGGARRLVSLSDQDYAARRRFRAPEKEAIAALAADLIPDDCSITLNIGTTTEQVARALTAHRDLVVVSNNINIIHLMMGARVKELILVGGSVRQSDGAVVGEEAVDFISRYKVDFAVIGASALDPDGSVLDFDAREVSVARAILRNARTRILVCDASKFDRAAPVRICDVADLDMVVTDTAPPAEFQAAARRGGTQILTLDASHARQRQSA
ncbi:MAG: DeoR/GlpR family DNA-binding transcription regulator [Pseudomonadota bacterium]